DIGREKFLSARGVKILRLQSKRADEISFWAELKKRLYDMKICAVMVEGGAKILTSAARSGAADYAFEYTADKVFESPDALDAFACPAPVIKDPIVEPLPPDVCRRGFLQK
ncbi:MAG: hypothetical protein IKO42_01945, partial [Opitutales bacterium]|nr:hypothetical protein [Opitutales bacterium]